MSNFMSVLLPHDLPEDWTEDQYVTPNGVEVELTKQHGYNYLMQQVNNTQIAAVELAETLISGLSDNLLDNSYFVDPVNRLNGYFVVAGTEYYSDAGLLTPVDVLSNDTAVRFVNENHGIVVVDGVERYVAYTDMRQGYVHSFEGSFGFDRWWASGCRLAVDKSITGGIMLTSTSGNVNAHLRQPVPNPLRLVGRTVILSILVRSLTGNATMKLYKASGIDGSAKVQMVSKSLSVGLNTVTAVISNDVGTATYPYLLFCIEASAGAYLTMAAAKLELGSRQTLAYQDASDNWLLTRVPNKIIETVRCNGASISLGGQGMIVTPGDIGLSTANVLVEAEVM